MIDGAAASVAGRVVHDAVHSTHRVVQLPCAAAAHIAAHYQAVRLQEGTGVERGGKQHRRNVLISAGGGKWRESVIDVKIINTIT